MNIILTGFMGTGKTLIGKLLSERLNYKYIDIDTIIEEREKMAIVDIFREKGEGYFRNVETEVIREFIPQEDNSVISVGGGAILRKINVDIMKNNGIIVLLTATPETIYERLKHDTTRPLLKVNNPKEKIVSLLSSRNAYYYENCNIAVSTNNRTPEDIVEEIISKLKIN
jgi:shikimate kinase